MFRKGWIIVLILLVGVVVLYYFPISGPSFDQIYENVDSTTRQSLDRFRSQYPTRQLELDGNVWNYVSMGQGPETILFLHGMSGAYDIWWQQLLDLKADVRVIAVTYPPVKSLSALTQGVLPILKTEAATSVYVVGTSLGGYFSQYLVAKHPRLVKKAIFANTFPPNNIIAEKTSFWVCCYPVCRNGRFCYFYARTLKTKSIRHPETRNWSRPICSSSHMA